MSIFHLNQALSLIERNLEQADFVGARNDKLISLAETVLGLKFPPTYRAFLKKYGCGDIAGKEFYGLISENFENSSIPDSVWLTLSERSTSQLPIDLILISSTGDGAYYAINCSKRFDNQEHPIVIWEPGTANPIAQLEIVSRDFGEFLLDTLEEALQGPTCRGN